ncbi:MAG TPA: carbamate kinase, partial [Ornithinibacter sp.]|nr:carbamate kinase [Ornithinibacter sp.]HQD69510.1 carbamate kinase [Ornithinibacter sp.]
ADVLVIATDVDHAAVDWGTPTQRDLGRVTVSQLRAHAADGQFASGSMGPKVDAAIRFVAGGGPRSVITSLTHITDAVEGSFGTVVDPD